MSAFEPLLDEVKEWVAESYRKLDEQTPAEIEEEKMSKQHSMVEVKFL